MAPRHTQSGEEASQGMRSTFKRLLHSRRAEAASATESPTTKSRADVASPIESPTMKSADIREPGVTIEVVTQQYSAGELTYDSAKLILKGGVNVTGPFPPLQSAVSGLLAFVERMDSTAEVDEHLASLITRIDQISTAFRSARFGYLCSNDELQRWAADLAKRIDTYRELITLKRQRSVVVRFLAVEDDQQHIEKTQRDLDGVFQDFIMSTTGSIASNMDRLVREHSYARLRSAPGAGYESQDVQPCTQDGLLDEVENWAKDPGSPSILWATGAPLVGKTCIAYALCQRLDQQHLLGGSFFCSKETEERQEASRIIPTLALALACSATSLATQMQDAQQPDAETSDAPADSKLHTLTHARFRYASRLASALQGHSDATHFAPPYQLTTLISEPAAATFIEPSLPPCIFVIDGVDECADPHAFLRKIVPSIISSTQPALLKFVITSRFDERINDQLILPRERTKEIRLLVLAEPGDVTDTRHRLRQLTGDTVPLDLDSSSAQHELHALARQTYFDSLFGATALRYLAQHPHDLINRLRLVADTIYASSDQASRHGLFDLILSDSLASIRESGHPSPAFQHVLPPRVELSLSSSDWSKLTSYLEFPFSFKLSEVNASLEGNEAPEVDDASDKELVQYLNDSPSTICKAWRRRNEDIHLYLLRCCLSVMEETLRFNVSGAQTSYLSNETQNLKANIPGHVAYACAAWIEHTVIASPSENILARIAEILRKRFLFWLEVMSVVTSVSATASLLQKLHGFCLRNPAGSGPTTTIKTLADLTLQASEFVLRTGHAVWISTPHIYLSALCVDSVGSDLIQALKCEYKQTARVHSQFQLATVSPLGLHSRSTSTDSIAPSLIVASSEYETSREREGPATTQVVQPPHGHDERVGSVIFSADNQTLASASWDKTIRLWDAHTGEPIGQPFWGHTDTVYCIAFSPDGRQLASSSADGSVRLWNAQTGTQIDHEPLLYDHGRAVYSIAFSPDGHRLVSAWADRAIRLFDLRTRTMAFTPFYGHIKSVYSVTFSPDGERLASASWDQTLRLWNARTGSQIGEPLQGHIRAVNCVAFSPDGTRLASASLDKTIRLWDAQTGYQIGRHLQGHTKEISSVAFSPDGQRLVSSSGDRTIRLWDALTGEQIGQPLSGHADWVKSVVFSPNGYRLASASWDKTIRLWDARSEPQLSHSLYITPSSQESPPRKMEFSPIPEHHGSLGALLQSGSFIEPRGMFIIDKDGWIRGPQDELILWILPEHRRGLWWPCTEKIIGEHLVYLDLSQFVHGEDWTDCYTGMKEDSSDNNAGRKARAAGAGRRLAEKGTGPLPKPLALSPLTTSLASSNGSFLSRPPAPGSPTSSEAGRVDSPSLVSSPKRPGL